MASVPETAPSPKPVADHLPGIDGLRALAVIGVLLYHADVPGLFPGGFLGVDMFFTLSGFLITWLLAREFRNRGTIAVNSFYVRRARRLLPAAFALLGAAVLAATFLAPDALGRLRGDVPAALTYTSNWWQIFSGQSYFEMIGRPALLQHLWSLAIEEQFYVVWPAVVLIALRLGGARSLGALSAGLAIVVTAWMGWLSIRHGYPEEADPSRVYLGTDTHTMGLLVGAAVGALWTPRWKPARVRAFDALGAACLVAVIGVMAFVNEANPFLYRGGFLAFSLVSTTLVLVAADSRTRLGGLLARQPLRWIGQRSYGIYLWHWPIFCLLRPGFEMVDAPWPVFGIRLALTLVFAELSYRVIEDPVRTGSLFAWSWPRKLALAGVAGAALLSTVALEARGGSPIQPPADVAKAIGLPPADAVAGAIPASVEEPMAEAPGATVDGSEEAEAAEPVAPVALAPSRPPPAPGALVVTAIGDSVLLGAQAYLSRTYAGTHVDAGVGRQGVHGLPRARELRSRGLLGPTVLVHLGTNGFLTESHLRALLGELSDRDRVVVVNVRAPRRWTAFNNALIERVVPDFANARKVDWSARSEDHPEYFVSDGIHLSSAGMRAFAAEIGQACDLSSRRDAARETPVVVASNADPATDEAEPGRNGGPADDPAVDGSAVDLLLEENGLTRMKRDALGASTSLDVPVLTLPVAERTSL